MRPRQCVPILLALALALLLPQTSQAQNVKALLTKGNKLFSSAEYEAALKVFQDGWSQSKKKEPAFLRSMAFCQLKLYRHRKAQEHLKEYISTFKKAPDLKKLKDLAASLEVVVETKVTISSTPPGASIYIDAEAAGKVGKTPMELTIEPGKHIVILKLASYYTTTESFTIKARETKPLAVVMEVPISVSSTPDKGSVHFGSATAESLGVTPLETGIKPGNQKVYIKKEGYKTYEASLNVAPGQPAKVDAQLQLGINVASTPPGATVEVDGTAVEGKTPMEAAVTSGSHTVTVKLPPCNPSSQKVDVQPGTPVNINARLSGCGLLSMRTDVEGAAVKVGAMEVGATPLDKAAVAAGNQKLVITHPDRRSLSRALDFSDTELISAKVKLGRPSWPAWVLGGVAVASLVMGAVGHSMAVSTRNEEVDGRKVNVENKDGTCEKLVNGAYERHDCSSFYTGHHLATAGYVIAGTTAASSFLYYWFFVRPKLEITRSPIGEATTASR